jgi:hypothetical protein
MNLAIAANGQKAVIRTSDVFDPYSDIVMWLKSVTTAKQPSIMQIDEEGDTKILVVLQTREEDVRFLVADYDYGESFEDAPEYPGVYIDVEIDRTRFLEDFCTPLYRALSRGCLREGRQGRAKIDMGDLRQYFIQYH